MKYTQNYGFELPEENEFYDVNIMNRNLAKLDELLKKVEVESEPDG